MQVAARTAPKSMPVLERTAGCTNMMYDIVMNVVRPASSSVRTVVRHSDNLKVLSKKSCISYWKDAPNSPAYYARSELFQHRIPNLASAEFATDILSHLALIHAGHDRILDGVRRFVQTEMLEQHRRRQDRSHRVCDVVPGQRRRGAMDGFEQRNVSRIDIAGCRHSESALQCRSEIRNDVAEHVVGHDHLKILRLSDHQQAKRVNVEMAGLNPGMTSRGRFEASLPQIAGVSHHVGLVAHADFRLGVPLRVLERVVDDPLHALSSVDFHLGRNLVRRSFLEDS